MTPNLYPEDEVWLGRVDWVAAPSAVRVGHLSPLAFLADGTGPWRPVENDLERLFPDRGRVFWHDVPKDVAEQDLVRVRVERRLNYARGEQEAYQVEHDRWRHVYEVVDLRGWGNERAVRLALTGEGLDLTLTTPHVYVRLDDETAVGPFTLERAADGRWRLPETAHEHVETRRLLDEHYSTVTVEGREVRVLHDPNALGRPTGLRNWLPDEKLAAGLLRRLRKLDREAAKALDVTDAVLRKYVESHGSFLFQNDLQQAQEAARFQRVEELRAVVAEDVALLHEAAEALLRHPDVQEALKEPKRALLEEARREAEERASAELGGLQAQVRAAREALSDLERRRQGVADELEALHAQLETRREEVREELAAAETELEERLAELSARPARLFAEAAVLRALAFPGGAAPPPERPVPRNEGEGPEPETTSDVKRATGALTQALMSRGFDAVHGAALTSAFATGRAVVVAGEAADEVLRAFADAFTGGRFTWIPISPRISDPTQLLGHSATPVGHLVAHPGGLLDVLLDAERDDRLHLVVLDGYDRAPAEHYLTPLLQCYTDARLERGRRTLPVLTADGSTRRVAWPPNVLLACVPEGGPGALPAGERAWRHAVLLDADGERLGNVLSNGGDRGGPLQLTATAWRGAACEAVSREELAPILSTASKCSPSAIADANVLFACASGLNVPPDDAAVLAFVGAILPLFRDVDELCRAVQTAFPQRAQSLTPRAEKLLGFVTPTLQ